MYTHIVGTGSALPERLVTNDELSQTLDTSDEWIVSHTGIRTRYLASADENAGVLGARAALAALKDANIAPEEVGTIIVSTSTPDYLSFPSVACLIQDAIGAKNAAAFDLAAACPGFVYALATAHGIMQLDDRPVLVVASEIMSRAVDWTDRNTCVLFGDGAGAVVLQNKEEPGGLGYHKLLADGSGARIIYREGGARTPETARMVPAYLVMGGRATFNFAVRTFCDIVEQTFAHYGWTEKDLAWVVPHQANTRIIDAAVKRINIPVEKFYVNIDRVANTSSASIPIALDEMAKKGLLKKGDNVILASFGAGLVSGHVALQWTK